MKANPRRRQFYVITALVFAAILGIAVFIVADLEFSYAKIEILGNSQVSFVISYDSTSATISPSENATVEVLPHVNVTVTATVSAPYTVIHWDVVGAVPQQKGPDAIVFLTGAGGSTVQLSVELGTSASG
ncbi:MAG: hypothetical protein JRN09_07480 [Nitrososphaerota archaeon]|nr:hypothetical protein [Nitrososphaerota archaeon]